MLLEGAVHTGSGWQFFEVVLVEGRGGCGMSYCSSRSEREKCVQEGATMATISD